MIQETVKLKGAVEILVIGPDGKVKQRVTKDNLVVTVGKSFLAAWLAATSQSTSFMPYTAVGSGTNAPAISDTALQTQVARAANTPGSSLNVLSLNITYGVGVATGAITEAGLFSAAVLGTLFSRVTFSVVNVGAGDNLIVNWSVTLS